MADSAERGAAASGPAVAGVPERNAPTQSAVSAYDAMLREKERNILANINKKRSIVHEVERQLRDLQLALHVNVGPRRQALEHLRQLLEQQNHEVDAARTNLKRAKQEVDHWQAVMHSAMQRKDELARELNMLVQESAGAQLQKLEELSDELEHLTEGLSADTANGRHQAARGPVPAAPPPAAEGEQQPAGEDVAARGGAAGRQAHDEQGEQQQQQQQRRQAAAEARGRHVQLPLGRNALAPGSGARGAASCIAAPPPSSTGASGGPFQGF